MAMSKYLSRSIGGNTNELVKRVCVLKPMEADHQIIHLNAGDNTIGRNRETGIRDTRCSKEQVLLRVDLNKGSVKLKVIGSNPSGVNGFMAMPHTECFLEHGDVLQLVYGRHPFEIIFKPPPEKVRSDLTLENKKSIVEEDISGRWESIGNGKLLVFTCAGVRASTKIAAYDLDGTVIRTKSGNVFPKHADDWQINYPEVPKKLQQLQEDGYKLCFFTNQAGIAKGRVDLDEFKMKIWSIIKRLGVKVQAFVAIGDGYYRKPLPGMWDHLVQHENAGVQIERTRSFYVGDAAGRPESGSGSSKRRKDHSLADRLFAANIDIAFYTPEEHFLGAKTEPWTKPDFDPLSPCDELPLLMPSNAKLSSDGCEMIIMVGLPGSGKSHFCNKELAPRGYTVANADTLGSTQACLKSCEGALAAGKSCVVDNTNVDVESRKKFVNLANRLQVKCRCFLMSASVAQVKHNIAFRQLTDPTHSHISEMLLNMMKKKYKAPTLAEGFVEIVKVNLKPHFNSIEHERLYKLYLVEK